MTAPRKEGAGPRTWTVRVVREDGLQSHTLRVRRGPTALATIAAVLLVASGGVWLGWTIADRSEDAELASLRTEVETLRGQQRQVAELARRLERAEAEFTRVRGLVTEGAPSRGPAVDLPAVPVAADPIALDGSGPAWPVAQRGFITRTFGSVPDVGQEAHPGIDIAVPSGSYVRSMEVGVVEEVGEDEVYGRYVRIAHGDGLSSLYGHNSWIFVAEGDSVARLEVVALSGSTGRSTAPHVHFEIYRNGELLDPLAFVNAGRDVIAPGGERDGVEQR